MTLSLLPLRFSAKVALPRYVKPEHATILGAQLTQAGIHDIQIGWSIQRFGIGPIYMVDGEAAETLKRKGHYLTTMTLLPEAKNRLIREVTTCLRNEPKIPLKAFVEGAEVSQAHPSLFRAVQMFCDGEPPTLPWWHRVFNR